MPLALGLVEANSEVQDSLCGGRSCGLARCLLRERPTRPDTRQGHSIESRSIAISCCTKFFLLLQFIVFLNHLHLLRGIYTRLPLLVHQSTSQHFTSHGESAKVPPQQAEASPPQWPASTATGPRTVANVSDSRTPSTLSCPKTSTVRSAILTRRQSRATHCSRPVLARNQRKQHWLATS